ncbi:3-keto sterol reductase [Flammula alnicola]|nr:3-keto sterol reductase [Flammula alnicola]
MVKTLLAPPLVVIVTGANGGVGYGICQRLLLQLCQLNPPDGFPQGFSSNIKADEQAPAGYKGITLIMACRNMKRAEVARTKLLQWLDNHLATLKRSSADDEDYVRTFRAHCDIQIHELDLASVSSTLKFAATIKKKVPYVSHLVCNAGVASFSGIDWLACFKQLAVSPMTAITAPEFYLQHEGEISPDNIGWVWQSNVFGHFVLFRELETLLAKSPFESSRVLWCSSLEASPKFYDSRDWQLKITEHSYESTKYQIDLIATNLDQLAVQSVPTNGKRIRHFITEPGVCSTTISQALVGPFLDILKVLLFYLGRLFGSPHHSILPLKAAIAAVHLILVPLCFLPGFLDHDPSKPVRYGAQTGRWGDEYVGLTVVKEWDDHKEEGKDLIKHCDELYKSWKQAEAAPKQFEKASERM